MPLINCEGNLILTWSSTCVITNSTGAGRFEIIDTKLYAPVVPLPTQDNAKLLQLTGKKFQSDPKTYAQNQYLNHLVDLSFQGVNRLFVLPFENENGRTSHSEYYLPKVEIKDYNVKTDGKIFFNQSVKNNSRTYENIKKIATGQWDDCTTDCLLDYLYFKENYKMIAINLSKPLALNADPRTIQQINFTSNLHRPGNTTMFFIIEEAKETVLDFSQRTVKVL